MRYVVVGPGALGTLFSCMISRGLKAEETLHLLDHDRERAAYLDSGGITYEYEGSRQLFRINVTDDLQKINDADVILLCVKSHDLQNCLARLQPCFSEKMLVLFLQNGIGHLEYLNRVFPATGLLGSTTEGANMAGKGHVHHAGRGETKIGMIGQDLSSPRLSALMDALRRAEMNVEVVPNVMRCVWDKLLINVGINCLTVIHDCPNGDLVKDPGKVEVLARAVREAQAVAHAMGYDVSEDPVERCMEVCRKTAANISSMLQDIRRQRPTEVEAINGMIIRYGSQNGIATETNRYLVEKVREIEKAVMGKNENWGG